MKGGELVNSILNVIKSIKAQVLSLIESIIFCLNQAYSFNGTNKIWIPTTSVSRGFLANKYFKIPQYWIQYRPE